MSTAEKWDVFFKFISVLVAVGAGWFTISRWYLAKILEYEVECLKNIATITAHWDFLKSRAESRDDQKAIDNIQIVVDDFEKKNELLTSSNLSFKDLREYNKRLHNHAAYAEKYSELSFKNLALKKDSNKKIVAKPKQVE